jgi:hypothetical protein
MNASCRSESASRWQNPAESITAGSNTSSDRAGTGGGSSQTWSKLVNGSQTNVQPLQAQAVCKQESDLAWHIIWFCALLCLAATKYYTVDAVWQHFASNIHAGPQNQTIINQCRFKADTHLLH